MSNFMSDSVLSEKIGVDVWKQIVKKFLYECAIRGDIPQTKLKFKEMIAKETAEAEKELRERPSFSLSPAEYEAETEDLLECLNRSAVNVAKNYMPVINRAWADDVNLLDENGQPKGKSRLEAEYKANAVATDADVASQKDPEEIAKGLYATLVAYCNKHSIDINAIINS